MSEEKLIFVRKATGLRKEVGVLGALLFPLCQACHPLVMMYIPMLIMMYPGCDLIQSFLIATIINLFYVASSMLLATAMPRSGGSYVAISRSLHPIFGAIEGWRVIIGNPMFIALILFMSSSFLGSSLAMIGYATSMPFLVNAGAYLMQHTEMQLVVTFILAIIFGIINVVGLRVVKYFVAFFAIVSVAGMLITVFTFYTFNPPAVQTNWDMVWGSGAYQEVVNTAIASGWKSVPYSWEATILTLLMTWGFLPGAINVFPILGEISKPKKSIPLSFLGAALILPALYMLATGGLFSRYGDFIGMYNVASMTGQLEIIPSLAPNISLFAFTLANPIFGILIALAPVLGGLGFALTCYLWVDRSIFAMAFDRYLPEFFARISPRWHTPTNGVVFSTVLILFFSTLTYLFPVAMTVSNFAVVLLMYLSTCIGAIALPYHRPSIWKTGFKWAVKGVPIIAILGFCGTVSSFYLMIMGFRILDTLSIIVNLAFIAIAIVSYMYYSQKLMKRGMSPEEVFSTVPPD